MRPAGDIRAETNAFTIAASEFGDDILADTLAVVAEQLAQALDCHECCVHDCLPEREALRALALCSRLLTARDREWIGEVHALQEIPDFQQVIDGREARRQCVLRPHHKRRGGHPAAPRRHGRRPRAQDRRGPL